MTECQPVRASRRRLVIMVKAPVAGRVKTRLAREIGVVRATAFYRHLAANIIRRVGNDPRWRTLLAVTPDSARAAPLWPASIPRIVQGRGDLGARMQRIMEMAAPGPLIIVGTDIARLDRNAVAAAFRLLERNDSVLGPAGDGGYWLVGLRRSPRVRKIFERVAWSSPRALADTLANIAPASCAIAPTLEDVDTAADYFALRHAASRLIVNI